MPRPFDTLMTYALADARATMAQARREEDMTELKVGDYVTYTGVARHDAWYSRFHEQLLGKVTSEPSWSGSTRVDWGTGPAYVSSQGNLRKLVPGDTIRGVAKHGWGEDVEDGFQYVVDGCLQTHSGHVDPRGARLIATPEPVQELTLESVPEDVYVIKNTVTGNRQYLHRVGTGDSWTLSYYASSVDGDWGSEPKPWVQAASRWFTEYNHVQTAADFEIVARGTAPVKTKEEETTVSEFIGKATPGPKYVLPFKTDGSQVQDANGNVIVDVDLEHDYDPGDDDRMAQTIRDALNEKFGA